MTGPLTPLPLNRRNAESEVCSLYGQHKSWPGDKTIIPSGKEDVKRRVTDKQMITKGERMY